LLGDMFDFLTGEGEYTREFYSEHLSLINKISQKVEIFYFEGNHDFNLREIFPRAKVYPNATQPVKFICESDEAVQIAHGDLFLPRLTQFALLSLRNRTFLKFMDLLDRALKFKISKMILKSQEGKNLYRKMPNFKDIIAPKIDFYAANLIIEGHYHQGELFDIYDRFYINLPCFACEQSYFVVEYAQQKLNLLKMSLKGH